MSQTSRKELAFLPTTDTALSIDGFQVVLLILLT